MRYKILLCIRIHEASVIVNYNIKTSPQLQHIIKADSASIYYVSKVTWGFDCNGIQNNTILHEYYIKIPIMHWYNVDEGRIIKRVNISIIGYGNELLYDFNFWEEKEMTIDFPNIWINIPEIWKKSTISIPAEIKKKKQ